MAGSNEEVIKSFLVSLGFKVDGASSKKFDESLVSTTKMAMAAGKAVVAVGAAAQAMVAVFSYEMEKLYYASQRTGASVENLQALESGARRIGISAGVAQSALESMSGAMRMNPGLEGLLNGFGVKTDGVDKMHVMMEMVQKFSQMPHYTGARFAQMFGMDEQTFLMMTKMMPELLAAEQRRIALNKEAGLNADEAAESSKHYENALRDVGDRVSVLSGKIASELQPIFLYLTEATKHSLDEIIKFTKVSFDSNEFSDELKAISEDFKNATYLLSILNAVAEAVKNTFTSMFSVLKDLTHSLLKFLDAFLKLGSGDVKGALSTFGDALKASPFVKAVENITGEVGDSITKFRFAEQKEKNQRYEQVSSGVPLAFKPGYTGPNPLLSGGPAPTGSKSDILKALEKQYGLPEGLMDRLWETESGRGKNKIGPLLKNGDRAIGDFQFTTGTAKDYGVTDRMDFNQEASAAAKYMHNLLKKYGGDVRKAAAAYNWGPGNVDKRGLGMAPHETVAYMDKVGGKAPVYNQQTSIVVNGAGGNPQQVAIAIGDEQSRVNGDVIRNMAGVVQ